MGGGANQTSCGQAPLLCLDTSCPVGSCPPYFSLPELPTSASNALRLPPTLAACRQSAEGAGAPVACHGPVSQAALLVGLGIQARLEQLLEAASEEEAEGLATGFM